MKKILAFLFLSVCLLSCTACRQANTHEIKITIPAGNTGEFVYSQEEISPAKNKIIISAGTDKVYTEVLLKPIEVKEENAYEPAILTPGVPVQMYVEKGAWFKVGISAHPCDTPITVSVIVEDVKVRIP